MKTWSEEKFCRFILLSPFIESDCVCALRFSACFVSSLADKPGTGRKGNVSFSEDIPEIANVFV